MKTFLYFFISIIFISFHVAAQQQDSAFSITTYNEPVPETKSTHVFKIKPWLDIPVTAVFDAWSFYGMSVIYGRDPIPEAEILALDKNNVNKFDRPIIGNYSLKAKSASDIFFYGSMPLPLFLLLDKKIRKDGLRVGLLFLETMGTTGVLYITSAMIANRYRPTATTGLLRLEAGQHFKTDVITGTVIGILVGILVPHFHKNRSMIASKLSLLPNLKNGGTGFTALYKLGK